MRLASSILTFAILFGAALAVARSVHELARRHDEGEARRILERLASEGQPPHDAIHEARQRTEGGWLEIQARVRHDGQGRCRVDFERLVELTSGGEVDLLHVDPPSPGWGGRRGPGAAGWARDVYLRLLQGLTRIQDVDLALANYRVEVASERGRSGRPCSRVLFSSPDGDRPAREFLVDEVTGFVLSVAERSHDGELVSAFRVRSVEYRVPEEDEMAAREGGRSLERGRHSRHPWASERREVPVERLAREVDFPVFLPEKCPRGFRLERALVLFGRAWRKVQLDYTDGLCRLQLVERPIEEYLYEFERTMESAALPREEIERSLAGMRFHMAGSDRRRGRPVRRWAEAGLAQAGKELDGVRLEAVGPIPSKQLVDWIDSLRPSGGVSTRP